MRRFSGKTYDIQAYLASDAIDINTFQLCQELERLSDDAIRQLWEVLGAQWTVARQIENAYWDGILKGREESQEEAYEKGVIDGEKNITPDDFPSVMLIEALKRRGLWESDEVTEP
jgi:hypothetical protein